MLGSLVEGFRHDLFASMREATPIPYPFPVGGGKGEPHGGAYIEALKNHRKSLRNLRWFRRDFA